MTFSKVILESKHTHGADLNTKNKAKRLRKNMTPAEKILWGRLRNRRINNMYFRRQHPYGFYIIDFFCTKANLAIEIDGEIHKFKGKYDKERTKCFEESGIRIIRFSNEEVESNIDNVIEKIKDYLLKCEIIT